jgi:glutathionylspermidine synthase
MIPSYREEFNRQFSEQKYKQFLDLLNYGELSVPFRVAETPVFIPSNLKEMLVEAGNEVISLLKHRDFKMLTQEAIPARWNVPNENDHPHFLTLDFGICKDEEGNIVPKLIELQGFPSLYGFQPKLAETYQQVFGLPELTPYFNGMQQEQYIHLLKKVIVGCFSPFEVALMDVDAPNQKTAVDFYATAKLLGIKVLSLHDIVKKDKKLFYEESGKLIQLKRIYNRLIFDEISDNAELFKDSFDPREDLEVEWITHPNWFYRVSKYTMPFLKSDFVPATYFLHKMASIPEDLDNYVLKPLFSFAGMGVIIDIKPSDIEAIKDPENWILQRKVNYEPVVQSPGGGVKVEIRLMYLWPDGEEPQLCINLVRLSKGKMIGVRYNKDFTWVGGTIGLME